MRDVSAAETAVEQHPAELVERPPKDVTFVARCHNLILSIFPELRDNYMGMARAASPGYRLQFVGHNFTVTREERREFQKFIAKYGRLYAYDDEDFEEIKARSLEDWVRAKASFGSNNSDGFYELTPTIPEPTDELLAILDAFTRGDEDAIEAILDAEVAEHNRPKVIEAANKALERLYAARAEAAIERAGSTEGASPADVLAQAQGPENAPDA
jgi:hypothetical protein